MKKILGIMGSPRRNGNTHILVTSILKGAKEKGAKVDILFLNDLDINECKGCHICWDEKQCCIDDDMNDIYPKIIESDAIIFGTPVYWYGPTALMKGFIDRFVYFNCPKNRVKIKDKQAVLAIPFEEKTAKTSELLVVFFEKCFKYLQMNLVSKIIVPGVGNKGEILKKKDYLNKAYELGRTLANNN